MSRSRFPRNLPQRALAWLLLTLLLPLAQAVAAGHALSHFKGGTPEDPQALHAAAHCELCIVAAAVTGGAPPLALPGLPPSPALHAQPLVLAAADGHSAFPPGYRSRAPPAFAR